MIFFLIHDFLLLFFLFFIIILKNWSLVRPKANVMFSPSNKKFLYNIYTIRLIFKIVGFSFFLFYKTVDFSKPTNVFNYIVSKNSKFET